jgi:hypothetical protein
VRAIISPVVASRVYVNQARTPVRRRQQRRTWPILVPWAIPIAVFAGIAIYGYFTPYTVNRQPPGKPGGLVWGDATFSNRLQVSAWLRLHGGSYPTWKRRHPAALALVTPRKRALARRRAALLHPPLRAVKARRAAPPTRSHRAVRAQPATRVRKPVRPAHAAPIRVRRTPARVRKAPVRSAAGPPSASVVSASRTSLLLLVLTGIGLFVALTAFLPPWLLARVSVSLGRPGYRAVSIAVSIAILAGVAAAVLLE